MGLFKIAFSNMKKRKGATVTLLCMIIIASLMLIVGLNLIMSLSSFYDTKVDELNGADFISFVSEDKWDDSALDFATTHENVTNAEVEDILRAANADIKINGVITSTSFLAYNMDTRREIAPLEIIDKLSSIPNEAIVAPLYVKISGGYKSGDEFKVTVGSRVYTFKIYGFFEDTVCGSNMVSMKRFYLADSGFNALSADNNFEKIKTLSVAFENRNQVREFEKAYKKIIFGSQNDVYNIKYDVAKEDATSFLGIMGVMIIAFAIIIFGVAVVIIRFNIYGSIDEDIKNFGALKSVGYTTKQIVASILVQYLFVAACACFLGVIIGSVAMPFVGNLVAGNSGLLWISGFDPLPAVITVFSVLGITSLIAFFTGTKSKKITPVSALRQGLDTRNVNKSRAALSNRKLPLHINLGLKNILGNIKNSLTVFGVVAIFLFACVLSNVLFYNFVTEKTAMIQMTGLENAEVVITFFSGDNEDLVNAVREDAGVRKIIVYDEMYVSTSDTEIKLTVSEDFTLFETNIIAEGRQPRTHYEISIGSAISELSGKKIGDMITLELGAVTHGYLVTGITQGINGNGGFLGCITTEGFKELDSGFKARSSYVFLNNGVNREKFIERYNVDFAGRAVVSDFGKAINAILDSVAGTIKLVIMLIVAVTVIVVALVLFLLISALIRKMKKNIGIMKALGYSNAQLIRQIIYTFMPSAIIGSIAGLLLGIFGSNALCSVLMSTMGVLKATFIVPIPTSIIIGLSMVFFNLIVTVSVSLRIKRITPYKLIVE